MRGPAIPSIAGFIRSCKHLISSIMFIEGIKGKLALTIAFVLSTFPSGEKRTYVFRRLRKFRELLIKDVQLNVKGFKYTLVDMKDIYNTSPLYEREVWLWLRPKKGDVFVDVGAHIGAYTLRVARIVGDEGLVVALEPEYRNYNTLLKNIELNGLRNVIALNVAAYSSTRKLTLFISYSTAGHSIKHNEGHSSVEVQGVTLDDILMSKLSVKRVDWIKIDVEGAEIEVLKGSIGTLEKNFPKLIVEVENKNIEAFLEFMEKCNYKPIFIKGLKRPNCTYFFCKPWINNDSGEMCENG